MSIKNTFNAAAQTDSPSHNKPAKRPAPFSIRLSKDEREQLTREAEGMALGAYIKAKALDGKPLRKRGPSVADQKALAQALALLGSSKLSSNINQLAYLANIGAYPATPQIEAGLMESLDNIRQIRVLLVTALGLKAEGKR